MSVQSLYNYSDDYLIELFLKCIYINKVNRLKKYILFL